MEEMENIPEPDDNDSDPREPVYIKKLHKSEYNKIVFGVCGGMGKYFSIDPLFFRLIFLFGILLGGWGVIIYLVFALVLKKEELSDIPEETEKEEIRRSNSVAVVAGMLLLLGLYELLDNYGYFSVLYLLGVPPGYIISLIIGAILFFILAAKESAAADKAAPERLIRESRKALFGGVCSGFADYLGISANTVRIIFILISFLTLGIPVILYFVFMARVPRRENEEV